MSSASDRAINNQMRQVRETLHGERKYDTDVKVCVSGRDIVLSTQTVTMGAWGEWTVTFPNVDDVRAHVEVFKTDDGDLAGFGYDVYLPRVVHKGHLLKACFSMNLETAPDFVDNIMELIEGLVCTFKKMH